jgi:hypothetical protein
MDRLSWIERHISVLKPTVSGVYSARIFHTYLKEIEAIETCVISNISPQSDAFQNLRYTKYIPSICSPVKPGIFVPVWMNK